MAPFPLTPPSSSSEESSPLAARRAAVSKKGLPFRSSTSKPASPKFTWKAHHRRTLLVCHNMKLQANDLVRVFNTLYQEDCTLAGYQDGVKRGLLQAQWQEHRKSTCKSWQTVLASSETELGLAKREIEDCLVNDLGHFQTPLLSSYSQARTIPKQNKHSPSSIATTSHNAYATNVAAKPLKPASSTSIAITRCQKPAVTRTPRQLVSVVIETRKQTAVVTSTRPSRNIFNQSPRSMVTSKRTRTVDGKQVPIIRATDRDLVVKNPITDREAHSAIPELLFRFYDDNSQGVRTQRGEISGRYAYLPCEPPAPPPCDDDRMFAAVLNHLNRDETVSELISTTSNLFFALRLAAKSNANPHIYVIRGGAMPSKKVFHLWPYHLRFLDEKLFYNGRYRNPSSHEYALWATLPRTAILGNFALADLERHLVGNPQMSMLLRINEMRTNRGNVYLRQLFKKDHLHLTLAMVDGIAQLMPSFGITIRSHTTVIARLVSELIRGFVLELPKTSPTQWDVLAGAFAYALSYHAKQTHVAEIHLVQAKEAFLSGARTGLGELNWHLNAKKQTRMIKKGVSLGLGVETMVAPAVNKNFQKAIARFAYKGSQDVEDPAIEDTDTLATARVDHRMEDEEEDKDEDTRVEDEEAETDIEEHIKIERSRKRISLPREATRQSPKKADETFIIYDRSDDEDYVEESDMEY